MDPEQTLHIFLRDDAGTPLGIGMPSGAPLRLNTPDGAFGTPMGTGSECHYDAWLRLLRADACSYCGGPGGTVDHIEPRSRPARGVGGAHSWLNVVGACTGCNGAKRDRSLLAFLRVTSRRTRDRAGRR